MEDALLASNIRGFSRLMGRVFSHSETDLTEEDQSTMGMRWEARPGSSNPFVSSCLSIL